MSTDAILAAAAAKVAKAMPPGAADAAAAADPRPRPIPLAALARGRVAAATARVFASDFDAPARKPAPARPEPAPEPEVILPTYSAGELDAARAMARAEGEAEGRRAARLEIEAEVAASLTRIEARLGEVAADALASVERRAEGIARLVLGALKAGFPAHAARLGAAELEAAARALLPSLADEPRISVRAHPGEAETLARILSDAIAAEHLEISIEARPDPRIPPGDGRIAWAGGEARRDATALWRDIEAGFAAFGLEPLDDPDQAFQPQPETNDGD